MEKNGTTIVIVIISALLLIGVFLFMSNDSVEEINWQEHYINQSKDPYGTYVVSELLKEYYPKKDITYLSKSVYKSIPLHQKDTSNYIFIGGDLYLSENDIDSLLVFVSEGNNAFISSKKFPDNLITKLFPNPCEGWSGHYEYKDTMVKMNLYHPNLTREKSFTYKSPVKDTTQLLSYYGWHGINSAYYCDTSVASISNLGYMEEKNGDNNINFIDVSYGEGHIFLHTCPAVFTNYYLLNEDAVSYAEKALSHLNSGDIYWDEFSKLPSMDSEDPNNPRAESPLKFILSKPSLKYAWYLT
ncbi:MAG: DUF4350 domain-containing protein, partial [Cytophagaceae bacterium]|nr:DUF4350 domain-containing protein [Cytophagaceae bacterium]